MVLYKPITHLEWTPSEHKEMFRPGISHSDLETESAVRINGLAWTLISSIKLFNELKDDFTMIFDLPVA